MRAWAEPPICVEVCQPSAYNSRSQSWLGPERYRSGHNGADSKSDGQGNLARGFESPPLRQ